jgi:hypothetical protein
MTSLKYVKRELFNPSIIKSLLTHQGLAYDTKQQLKKYHKKRVNGNCVESVYDYSKDYPRIGRVYVAGSVGLQGFEREVRNALAKDLYFDVDMENAHPTILLKICTDKGWVCDRLRNYVENREQVLADIESHYGASRKDAKNLMIRMMFLGHPESWVGETMCENYDKPMEYIALFKEEIRTIAQNVWGSYPEVVAVVAKKRKMFDSQKLSSCLSIALQTEEHKILMAIDDCMKQQGRSMDVFVYDGGLVRKKDGEHELPLEVLRTCEKYVKDTTGYEVKLVVKPMETSLEFSSHDEKTTVEPGVIIDDVYAAKEFAKLMKGCMVYTDKKLFVFNENQGLWTDDEVAVRQCVVNYEDELKFHQMDLDTGKIKLYNYSGNEKNMNNMLRNVPTFCVADDFFGKNADSSRGKLLFSDGIYDFDTDTFMEGFDPKIVFRYRIDRPFPKLRKEDIIKTVFKVLFRDTFMEDEYASSDCLRIGVARALYGDYRAKRFYFCVGKSNAGKGVLTDALKASFQGFIGTFNAGSLAYNDKNGADAAKQLSWVLGIKDKRMVISNEISMNKPIDGNLIKMLASGGDEFDARKNHKDEEKVINRSTMFGFVNDIPTIMPYDDAVANRVLCIDYKCVFTENEVSKDFERKADITIKDTFKYNSDYEDALVHIIIDSYKEFKDHGHVVPDCIREATKEWSGDAGSVEGLLLKKYEITRDMNDYVPAREIITYLVKDEKLKMSPKKIGMEMKGLKLVNDGKKINGKNVQVWFGVKESYDGYLIRDNDSY